MSTFGYTTYATYNGYGLDLGDLAVNFSGKNAKKLSNLWDEFVNSESDTLIDYYAKKQADIFNAWQNNKSDNKAPLVTDIWPNFTDDFKMLLIVPDVPGVQLEDNPTQLPTTAEANDLLYKELKNLLKAAQTDLDMSNDNINEILQQIKKPFYNNIDYHFSPRWLTLLCR